MDDDEFDYTFWQYDGDAESRFFSLDEAVLARSRYRVYRGATAGGKIRQYWVKEVEE